MLKINVTRISIFSVIILLIITHLIFLKINQWQLPHGIILKKVLIRGVINTIPEKKFHGVEFQFHATQFNHQKISTQFLIAWYHNAPKLKVGQRWQCQVKLKPPIGLHNPGGFDYQAYLQQRGISATGYVINNAMQNKLLSVNHIYFLDKLREKIQNQIWQSIRNPTLAAFISALCVGLRDGLSESDWQVFQKTGTNHLVAIAGLHIGFVASSIYFLSLLCIRFFPCVLLKIPATRFASIAALLAAFSYTALSGFAIPAQRASIMLFCFMITTLLYRDSTLWRRLLIAAIIILMLNPFDLGEASFWLSFGSIAILAWAMSSRLQSPKHLVSWIKMQGAIIIGLLPLMLLFFQQASLIAFLTNAIAIPWIGFLILPITLTACLLFVMHLYFFSHTLFWLAGKCLSPLWQLLFFSSRLHFASWHHAMPNNFILILAMISVIFLLAPKKFPAKYLGCFGLLPLFFYHVPHPHNGNYWVSVIDVGQGLSVLVQTQHHVLLYDTGSHLPGGFDMGESVVAPYLRYRGIDKINRLEISHGDNDHSGGADAIVKDFSVQSIFTSAPKLISHFHAQYCYAGQNWTWDGVHFETLNPVQNAPYADNNSSCVITISSKRGNTLLTGDIQESTEDALLQHYHDALRATVLLSPHHGSATSSSDDFLSAVSPRYVIISAGKYNRYHLPAQSVLDRYAQHHISVYNTADNGAVFIRFLRDGQVKLHSY